MKNHPIDAIVGCVLVITGALGLYFRVEYAGWIVFVGLMGLL